MKLIIDLKNKTCRMILSDGTSYRADSFEKWREIMTVPDAETFDVVKVSGYSANKDLFAEVVTLAANKCSVLDISDNFLNEGAIKIAEIIRSSGTIKEVNFTNTGLRSHEAQVLKELNHITGLCKVILSDNWIKVLEGPVVDDLFSTHSGLVLDVRHNSKSFEIKGLIGEYDGEHLIM